MKRFKPGDTKRHEYRVAETDIAAFQNEVVHPVCSTFALAREMEWTGRLFVLEMIADGEEGVGTYVNVRHKSPAMVGELLIFTATFLGNDARGNVDCEIKVTTASGRPVAVGATGQRIMPKTEIERRIAGLNK